MPLISVIIPNYNGEKWLSKTIDSCLQQNEYLHEIIIIDDHSTDNSWNVLSEYQSEYPDIIKTVRNKLKGGNHARNYGFELSGGEFIQWLDADDQLLPGKFAAQLGIFGKHADADIVYSDWQLDVYTGSGDLKSTEYKVQQQHEDFLLQLLIDNWSPPHNYLVRRNFAEKLHQINAWNPETPVFQDREYFTLAAIRGGKFQYAPGLFCVYNRWSSQSVSQNKGKRNNVLLRLFSEFAGQIENSDKIGSLKKKQYRKVIVTNKLLTLLTRDNLLVRDKDMKLRNINWAIIKDYRTKAKILFALILNKFSPAKNDP
jgi:glycosyltransferase involved in cell wall biosynthesis